MLKKKTLKNRFTTGRLSLVCLVGLLYGCQTPVYVSEAPSELVTFKRILVLPFKDVTTMSGDSMGRRCPVCGRVFVAGEVTAGAANFLSDQSIAWLKNHTDYQVVIERLAADSLAALYSANQETGAAKRTLVAKGRDHDADVVLVGFVYRFEERVGKGYSAESPASVAFGMHLIRVADGGTIWSAHFDDTQKSLGENLFQLGTFISRGGRWVTAEEMAMSGLEKIFKKFPKS